MSAPADSARRPVALVTGGGRGIGRAIVEALIADGWAVAFTWASDEAAARAVAEQTGGRQFHLDLRDRARPAALVAEIEKELGPVSGLVNNAAVRREGILAMTSDADWDEVLDVNLAGRLPLLPGGAAGHGLPPHGRDREHLVAQRGGGAAGQTAYAASKAGLMGLTRSLAREVGRKGVRVNVVVPGFVATELTAALPPAAVAKLRDTECLPAGTAPGDVAQMVAFLLSDRAAAITGQALAVDSGASA
jgi:3-oxoacyl-[acyl-carrier protein] reductase